MTLALVPRDQGNATQLRFMKQFHNTDGELGYSQLSFSLRMPCVNDENCTYSRSTVRHSTPGGSATTLAVRLSSLEENTQAETKSR